MAAIACRCTAVVKVQNKKGDSMRIAFVGGGNMARAIIAGLTATGFEGSSIAVKDHNTDKLEALQKDYGVCVYREDGAWISEADLVVLAVKPQGLAACLEGCARWIAPEATVLSIAAGVSTDTLRRRTGSGHIVRAMPNTPAMVRQGFTGLFAVPEATDTDRERAQTVMAAVGRCLWLDDEDAMHAVTAGPGSGVAYVFLFMQGLEEALLGQGLDADKARALTLATVRGASALADASDASFEELRARVTSKGGTTAKAIEAFEDAGLRRIIDTAAKACAARSREMAELFK